MQAFRTFDRVASAAGAIPCMYTELMALAVALTTQCPCRINIHPAKARQAGPSEVELADAAVVTAALRAGAAMTPATHALL